MAIATVAALLAVAGCHGPSGSDEADKPKSRTARVETETSAGDEVAPEADTGTEADSSTELAAPPLSRPTTEGCTTIVRAPASLQDAIDAVADHTTPHVLCLEGTFHGGGAAESPDRPGIGPYYGGVVIKGRSDFTLRGLPGSRILGIHNDRYYPDEDDPPEAQGANDKGNLVKIVDSQRVILEWLTIDGRVPDSDTPEGRPTLNRLVWFQHTTDSALRYSTVEHAGGECVRVKANSQRNEIHHNVIGDCGYFQFKVQKEERLQKNGEAVYIGTDPAQVADTQVNKQRYWGLDPALVTDRSSFNTVHHNLLRPGPESADWGNECVDIKEDWPTVQDQLPGDAARGEPGHNVVADNDCAGQFDPESGAFDSRGPNNVFEHNRVSGTVKGAAIRVGAKEKSVGDAGSVEWVAPGNVVRLNRLESFGYRTALKVFDDQPLAEVCGNVDGKGRTDFGGKFSNEPDAATNRARCSARTATGATPRPGPRGPVGVPSLNG